MTGDADHWRERAETALLIARQMHDPLARIEMLDLARHYRVLAAHADRRERYPSRLLDSGVPERHDEPAHDWELPPQHGLEGLSFPPETLSVLCRAFDTAWAELAPNVRPEDVEKTRVRLAGAVLSLASEDSRDAPMLARAALHVMDGDYRLGRSC
jgi:hypothetical protein